MIFNIRKIDNNKSTPKLDTSIEHIWGPHVSDAYLDGIYYTGTDSMYAMWNALIIRDE